MNILTSTYTTPYNSAPFAQIQMSDYQAAFETTIAAARAEIDTITSNLEQPTFENTIEALDFSGQTLDRLSSIFLNLN
jgi:peptidyl-dipeptidase Dcp